jgi:hypothetical protein
MYQPQPGKRKQTSMRKEQEYRFSGYPFREGIPAPVDRH